MRRTQPDIAGWKLEEGGCKQKPTSLGGPWKLEKARKYDFPQSFRRGIQDGGLCNFTPVRSSLGPLWWLSSKESACQCRRYRFDPWVRKILWKRKQQPTPVFLPGKFHEQRSLVGCSPWGHDLGTEPKTSTELLSSRIAEPRNSCYKTRDIICYTDIENEHRYMKLKIKSMANNLILFKRVKL